VKMVINIFLMFLFLNWFNSASLISLIQIKLFIDY
jgi:hypothetical protein